VPVGVAVEVAVGVGVSVNIGMTNFAFDAVIGFGLLMLLRWVTDLALLPHARIADEIVRDRNTNVGLLEGVIAVAVALLILFVF
jgi:uncharacterized membrane protein YjfL (UPF0719 family)